MPGSDVRKGFFPGWVPERFPSGAQPPSVDSRLLHAASFCSTERAFPCLGSSTSQLCFPGCWP
eukprot:11212361-Heterocapsa_arctica.AAC.1